MYVLHQHVDIIHVYERENRRKVKRKHDLQLATGF